MLLSSTQQRLRSEIWRYTPSSVAPSEPLVRQLQGISSRDNLWAFRATSGPSGQPFLTSLVY